ncbi:MAG: hypothetical protein J6J36_03345 [Clostridia bacterium]|nr:hypothetical protein [Clostridia bacterium]
MENNKEQSIGKFTKKFIINYFIGEIIIGLVLGVVNEFVDFFLPTHIKLVIIFTLNILGLWKISTSAVEVSVHEANIDSNCVSKVLKNIYFFLIGLCSVTIIFRLISFVISASILPSYMSILVIELLAKIVVSVIRYVIIIMICKSKLKQIVLGKVRNKAFYVISLIISIIIVGIIGIVEGNHEIAMKSKEKEQNIEMERKYEGADWEEIYYSSSTRYESGAALVEVSLGHDNKGKIKRYKVIKVSCVVRSKKDNSIVGEIEKYYENVDLEYGYFSFNEQYNIELSNKFIGDNCKIDIKAYGVRLDSN